MSIVEIGYFVESDGDLNGLEFIHFFKFRDDVMTMRLENVLTGSFHAFRTPKGKRENVFIRYKRMWKRP